MLYLCIILTIALCATACGAFYLLGRIRHLTEIITTHERLYAEKTAEVAAWQEKALQRHGMTPLKETPPPKDIRTSENSYGPAVPPFKAAAAEWDEEDTRRVRLSDERRAAVIEAARKASA
jgi:hypothetical protein